MNGRCAVKAGRPRGLAKKLHARSGVGQAQTQRMSVRLLQQFHQTWFARQLRIPLHQVNVHPAHEVILLAGLKLRQLSRVQFNH